MKVVRKENLAEIGLWDVCTICSSYIRLQYCCSCDIRPLIHSSMSHRCFIHRVFFIVCYCPLSSLAHWLLALSQYFHGIHWQEYSYALVFISKCTWLSLYLYLQVFVIVVGVFVSVWFSINVGVGECGGVWMCTSAKKNFIQRRKCVGRNFSIQKLHGAQPFLFV